MIQHRLVWSTESLKPKFSKISPLAGIKRLFSLQAVANFVKGLIKIAVLGAVMTALLWPQRHRLEGLVQVDLLGTLLLTKSLALQMIGAVVAILFLVAAADFVFQYRQWYERQKMSMRETQGGVQADRRRPDDQGQDPPVAPAADAQAHDGGGAQGLGDHHQPDPLRHRPAIRARAWRRRSASPRAPT